MRNQGEAPNTAITLKELDAPLIGLNTDLILLSTAQRNLAKRVIGLFPNKADDGNTRKPIIEFIKNNDITKGEALVKTITQLYTTGLMTTSRSQQNDRSVPFGQIVDPAKVLPTIMADIKSGQDTLGLMPSSITIKGELAPNSDLNNFYQLALRFSGSNDSLIRSTILNMVTKFTMSKNPNTTDITNSLNSWKKFVQIIESDDAIELCKMRKMNRSDYFAIIINKVSEGIASNNKIITTSVSWFGDQCHETITNDIKDMKLRQKHSILSGFNFAS